MGDHGSLWPPLVLAVLVAIDCGKSTPSVDSGPAETAAAKSSAGGAMDDASDPMDPREESQWGEAKDGEGEESMRLADMVGCAGLRDRAARPDLRAAAIRAMEYCRDFSELPWLAQLATEGNDADGHAALEVIVALAAAPRRATDPEDADELHAGCGILLSLARAPDRPRDRRVPAIRALRMLADRGCAKRSEIPADLDAK